MQNKENNSHFKEGSSMGELIIYQIDDGLAAISLRAIEGTVWLTQNEMAELFNTTKQNISLHLKNVFEDRELVEIPVVKDSLTTAADIRQQLIMTKPLKEHSYFLKKCKTKCSGQLLVKPLLS